MKDSALFNLERQQRILELTQRDGSVSVSQLAELFHVTTATIRADLSRLEAEGALTRTHGGAIANPNSRREPGMDERHNEDKKQRIALRAAELVREGDILLLDTGTTMVCLARALAQSPVKELTVFSNDIDVIRILEEKEGFALHLFAGRIRNGFHYCCGPQMISALQECHFGRLFLASSAVSLDQGLTTPNPELALIKQKMIESASQVILLADSSKLGHVDFRKFADLSQVDIFITDDSVSEEDTKLLRTRVKELMVV